MIGAVPWRTRTVTPVLPTEQGSHDGLAYSLWLPDASEPAGGIVILHGAGSCKESHHDFARAARAAGLAVIAFDQRGHGESAGRIDGRVLEDTAAIAGLLRSRSGNPDLRLALRGSSMGGYLAIVAAPIIGADAIVAICPASGEGLRRALGRGDLSFDADHEALAALLAEHDLNVIVPSLKIPLLLLHAEGDETVPVEHSRELAELAAHPHSRLIAVPGGHHRSVQHDPELQAISLRWLVRALG